MESLHTSSRQQRSTQKSQLSVSQPVLRGLSHQEREDVLSAGFKQLRRRAAALEQQNVPAFECNAEEHRTHASTLGSRLRNGVQDASSLQDDLQGLAARSQARSDLLSSLISRQQEARRLMQTVELTSSSSSPSSRPSSAALRRPGSAAGRPSSASRSARAPSLAATADTEALARSFWATTGRSPAASVDAAAAVPSAAAPAPSTPLASEPSASSSSASPLWDALVRTASASSESATSSGRNSSLWTAAAAAAAAAIEGRRAQRMFDRLGQWRQAPPATEPVIDARAQRAQQEEMADMLLSSTTTAVSNKTAEICCICLETMRLGEQVCMLSCMHRMHGPCVRRWLLGKVATVCPYCKQTSVSTG